MRSRRPRSQAPLPFRAVCPSSHLSCSAILPLGWRRRRSAGSRALVLLVVLQGLALASHPTPPRASGSPLSRGGRGRHGGGGVAGWLWRVPSRLLAWGRARRDGRYARAVDGSAARPYIWTFMHPCIRKYIVAGGKRQARWEQRRPQSAVTDDRGRTARTYCRPQVQYICAVRTVLMMNKPHQPQSLCGTDPLRGGGDRRSLTMLVSIHF